ncbi:MAG: hypothetical protein K6C35_09325 [Eubacterium sp.]|nr:hypothetical protein [Eubacterium sp.]
MKKMRRFIALLMSVLFLAIGMTPNTLFAEDERCRRVIKFSAESADIDKDDNETDNDKSEKTNDTEIMPASGEENGEESFDKDNAPWDEKHTDGWDYVMSHNIDGYYYFQFFNADGTLYDSGFFSQVGGLDLNCICIDADLNSGLDGYEFDIEKTDWDDPELCKVTYYALHNYGYADARRVICHYLRSKGRENNTHMPDFSDAVEAALNSSIPEDIRFSVSYLRNCAYPGNSGRYQDFMTWRESRIIKNDYYAAVRKTDGRNAGMSGVSFDVFIDGEFIGKIVTGADGIGSIKVGSFENAPTVTVKENWVEGYGDGQARFSHNTEVKTAGVYTTLQEALQHASEFTYVNYSYGYGTLVKRSSSTTYTESFKGIKYALFRNDGTRIADVEMGDDGKIFRVLKIYDTSKHFEEDVTYGGVKYKCIGGLRYDPNNKNNENNKYYWQEYETNEYYELDAETKVFFVMDDEYSTRPGSDASKYPLIYEVHPSISYATDKPYMDYYIAVKKVDEKGNTMAGVSFDVTINGVKKEKAVTTGGDGIAVYKVGSYTAVPRVIVTENWEDKRFIYNKSSKSVTAYKTAEAARSHAALFTYTNYAYGYATLVKESGRTGMKPSMAGIEYELRKSNGTRIAVVTLGDDGKIKKVSFVTSSDAFFTEKIDGKICIGGLNFKHGDGTNDNNYYWIETKTNEYYEINSRRYYFTINEENTVSPGSDITKYPSVTVINPAVTKAVDRPFLDYYVAVMKTDETGRKINGVTFDITVSGKTYKKALVSGMEIKNGIKTEKNDGIAVYCLGRYVSAPEVSITENWSDEEYIHNTETKKVIAYSSLEAARSHAEKYIYKNVRYTYTSLEKIPEDDTFLEGNDNYSLDNVMYGLYREEDQKLIAVVKLTQYEKNGKILAGIRSLDDITVKGGKPFYKKTHGGFNSVGGLTAGESYYWQELEDSEKQPINYLYNPEKYSFTADSKEADAPKVVTAVDRVKTGSITVVKTLDPDDIPGMSPVGAKYRIKGIDDFNKDYEEYFVIKEDGSSDVKKLIFGRYLIEEVEGPENGRWLLDENKYIVELTGGEGDKVLDGDSDAEDDNNEIQKESGRKDDGKKTGDEAAEDPENIQVELNVKAENATVISTDRIIKDKYYIAVSKQNDAGEAMEGVSFEAEIKETGEKI